MRQNHRIIGPMLVILHSLGIFVADLFKSRCLLEAENLNTSMWWWPLTTAVYRRP
jgi:hypothetical protein